MSDSSAKRGFTTAILHSDRDAPVEHGSLHKPLHLSVAYGYRDARELAAVFQGRAQGFAYGRQGNPTTAALEQKINRMEDGVATACFSTGMAAIGAIMVSLLRAGDQLDIMGPLGVGFKLDPALRHIVAVGRGAGLATLAPLAGSAPSAGSSTLSTTR